MRVKLARSVALVGILTLFQGRLGLLCGIAIAIAYELVGVSGSTLWAGSVGALALAPFAMLIRAFHSGPAVGAGFATGHLAARILVQIALALAAYAIAVDLTTNRTADRADARDPLEDLDQPG